MSLNKILGKIRKADIDYGLIDNNDKIAVGISGGKDSMVLLYALNTYKKIAKKYDNKDFDILGIHLDMGFENMDFSLVKDFFIKNNIQYYDIPTKIYEILKLNKNEDDSLSCSLCSKLKKGAIIQEAIKLSCNKTAFAHHSDDAVETLLLNAIYGGRLSTFSPKMYLTNTKMTFIRPFVYVSEKEITNTINKFDIPTVKSTCPMDGYTKRQDIKDLLNNLYNNYPMAKSNFVKMLHNEEQLDLWKKKR